MPPMQPTPPVGATPLTVAIDQPVADDLAHLSEAQIDALHARIRERARQVREVLRVNQAFVCGTPDRHTRGQGRK